MAVKVRRDVECRMTESLLNRLHRNVICKQKAGTAVTQVMETEHLHIVIFDNFVEVVRHHVGADELSEQINTHKAVKLRAVIPAAKFLVVLVHLPLFKEHFLDVRDKRQSSSGGVRFQTSFHEQFGTTVLIVITNDLALDRNGLFLEVDGIPLQTEYLTAAQTIIGSNVNDKFQLVTFEHLKQFIQFIFIIENSFMTFCSRYDVV